MAINNSKKPLLYLIGFSGLAVGTALWLSPRANVIDVERTRYASREACLQDWNDPADCEFVEDADGVAKAAAASDASDAGHGGGGHGGSYGGGHGGGGSGRKGAADRSPDSSPSGGPVDAAHDVATTKTTGHETSEGGSGHATSSGMGEAGWYGPYYTHDGVVYHTSGMHTTGLPAQHGTVSSLTVRESALSAGSSAFHSTPHSVSFSEGRAISRGGFLSSHGEGGGHGGEGGGHGSGGG
jgi:hypothetical protein